MKQTPKGTIVFFSMDALGHIHPILSIVRELKRRGHKALILTSRPLGIAESLKAKGFDLEHCEESENKEPCERNSEEMLEELMQPLLSQFRKGITDAYASTYQLNGALGKHLDDMIEMHDKLEAKLKSLKPDLIVFDHVIGIPCLTTVAPRYIRVYSGFPSVLYSSINDNFSAGLGLSISKMDKKWKNFELKCKGPLREKLRRYWKEKKAEDWPTELDMSTTSPYLNFYFGPEELGLENEPSLKPLPDVWFRLEHTLDDSDEATSEFNIPRELAEVPGKLIYFSLGTLVTGDIDLINRLLEILSKSPNKFVVSMGQRHSRIKLYPNMWGEKFVDQKAILKKANLFLTHGGHNSIIEAFYYGLPVIVLPVFADQFDSAQRIQDCGLGFRLNPYHCTQDELLGSIDKVLSDLKLEQRMKSISSRLRSIKYHQIAADKIEQLLMV